MCEYLALSRQKVISNLFEKMDWKIKREVNIPVGVQVVPVEGGATIYGEYRNQLSVKTRRT